MKRLHMATLLLLTAGMTPPVMASEFVVVAATGVVEPEGLAAGQQLDENTRIELEPWGRALIRETTKCGLTHVVAGLSEYVLTLSEDCSAIEEPMTVAGQVQQGDAFAARMQETGSGPADDLVSALANEPCVFVERLSEEIPNRRLCPSGHALRGVRCTGEYCDNKDMLCCPYLAGAPDPDAKETQSRQISEEWPNVMQSKTFLNGLTCWGPYCDNILPHTIKTPRLAKTKTCDWTVWASERPGNWLDCQLGRFVAGIRCRGDYCADIALHCCEVKVK